MCQAASISRNPWMAFVRQARQRQRRANASSGAWPPAEGRRGRPPVRLAAVFALVAWVGQADVGNPMNPLAGQAATPGPAPALDQTNSAPPDFFRRVATLAEGLDSPDGIAREPTTGRLFVSEEDAVRIVCIQPDGTRQTLFDRATPVYEEDGPIRKKVAGLRSPEGLALDGNGRLYAVEDVPGGRLISFDVRAEALKSYPCGKVVPLPLENSRYAWESIVIGPAGELLVAGSTLESFVNETGKEGAPGLFEGAILYRDAQGQWWLPMNFPMASYSAACFSADGSTAFFASEIPGDVGSLDLRSHNLRTFRANQTFHSPEGLAALPDGSAVVAEEGGKIYRFDPRADTIQLLYDNQSMLESVFWDNPGRRLLATDDQRGLLLALEPKAGADFSAPTNETADILFETQYATVEMIPERCPPYLSRVLKLGGYDPFGKAGEIAFRDFARKYSLVAVDADAVLLSGPTTLRDPIKHVQFVVVAPYLIGSQGGQFVWSSSGFAAIKASGQIVKTEMVKRQVIRGDLMECSFFPMGGQLIALPMPFSSRIDTEGVATIQFLGMGVTPDFLMMLNTVTPDQSFMLVMQPNEKPQLYGLYLPPVRNSSYWVIALAHKEPEIWRSLSSEP